MQPETDATGPKLGIGLEGTDVPALGKLVHCFQIAVLVGIDTTMDHQPFAAIQLRRNVAGLVGILSQAPLGFT